MVKIKEKGTDGVKELGPVIHGGRRKDDNNDGSPIRAGTQNPTKNKRYRKRERAG